MNALLFAAILALSVAIVAAAPTAGEKDIACSKELKSNITTAFKECEASVGAFDADDTEILSALIQCVMAFGNISEDGTIKDVIQDCVDESNTSDTLNEGEVICMLAEIDSLCDLEQESDSKITE